MTETNAPRTISQPILNNAALDGWAALVGANHKLHDRIAALEAQNTSLLEDTLRMGNQLQQADAKNAQSVHHALKSCAGALDVLASQCGPEYSGGVAHAAAFVRERSEEI